MQPYDPMNPMNTQGQTPYGTMPNQMQGGAQAGYYDAYGINQPNGNVYVDPAQMQGQPAENNIYYQIPNIEMPDFQVPPFMPNPQQQMYDEYVQQQPDIPTAQTFDDGNYQNVRGRRKKIKPRGGYFRNWKAALVVVVLICITGYILYNQLSSNAGSVAYIEMAQMGETYKGDALIIRDETAFDEEGVQTIDYVAEEGSVVKRGDVICYVYSTGYSTKESTALQNYRDEIKDYQQSLLAAETSYDQKMSRLETEAVERGLEVRSLVQGARGNLLSQEVLLEEAIVNRQTYFKSKYSSDTRMDRLFDEESTQQQRIDSWIKQKIATTESLVSFYTDGFEAALTPAKYTEYSPQEVRSMINGVRPATSSSARGKTDLYRLVKRSNFAVLLLVDDTSWNPIEGHVYKLVLEQFTDKIVDAQVLSFTRSGGELLLRLAVIGDVSDVLYMRTCTAQLGEYVDCMAVPEGALYQQNNMDGVVTIDANNHSIFVPVSVLGKSGGKAYISAITAGSLSVGQTVRMFK